MADDVAAGVANRSLLAEGLTYCRQCIDAAMSSYHASPVQCDLVNMCTVYYHNHS
jgi:hypothetical protein